MSVILISKCVNILNICHLFRSTPLVLVIFSVLPLTLNNCRLFPVGGYPFFEIATICYWMTASFKILPLISVKVGERHCGYFLGSAAAKVMGCFIQKVADKENRMSAFSLNTSNIKESVRDTNIIVP